MTREDAVALLKVAPTIHLAGMGTDGPILRTVHGVVVDDWLCFHSSPKGEKLELVDQPVVGQAEETIAVVPSTFFDPVRACPATTYYRSVQVHGVLHEVVDTERKAQALQALMEKLQPEGGHRPISANDPMYRAAVKGIAIVGVALEQLTGKAKLAQNRKPTERARLLEQLWSRGAQTDPRAIELIRHANNETQTPPSFLQCAEGFTLHCWLPADDAARAAQMLKRSYWNDRFTLEQIHRAHDGSSAWVGVRDLNGRLVATARAASDSAKYAWVYDVWVEPECRRRGVAKSMMRLLLDHPAVRHCARVLLGTRDMQPLYAQFGFVAKEALPPRPYATTEMVLTRGASFGTRSSAAEG